MKSFKTMFLNDFFIKILLFCNDFNSFYWANKFKLINCISVVYMIKFYYIKTGENKP